MIKQVPIRVLLADDEDIVRYGLNSILQAEPTVSVVGEAQNGEEAIAKTKALQPDIVLMDILMPVMDGVSATREICQAYPNTKVIILSIYSADKYLVEAMRQGAVGYLLKDTPPADFVTVIQASHKGYMQLGPNIGARLVQQLGPSTTEGSALATSRENGSIASGSVKQFYAHKGITPREQEVLHLIAEGASNREIANILCITEKTVKNHVSNLLKRAKLRNRTQLAIWVNNTRATAPTTQIN
ncbi:MAG: response regulator transcription factor [Cyanobacteria bacterium J06649_4]